MSPRAAWRLEETGFGLVHDYVGTETRTLMRFGVTTVQPGEQAADLAHRMHHAHVSRIVVTRSSGTLVGLSFAENLAQA